MIDTESAAATDNLQDINGVVIGDMVILSTTSAARDVVLKHVTGGGNFRHFMYGAGDVTLGQTYHYAIYHCRATGAGLDLVYKVN